VIVCEQNSCLAQRASGFLAWSDCQQWNYIQEQNSSFQPPCLPGLVDPGFWGCDILFGHLTVAKPPFQTSEELGVK
jgi:hypothetical protein